jgi:hypothetical protein
LIEPDWFYYNKLSGQAEEPNDSNRPYLNKTVKPIPEVGDHEIAVFTDGNWTIVEDHRGTVYDKSTRESSTFTDLGPLPSHLTSLAPPANHYVWSTYHWVIDLNQYIANKQSQLKLLCANEISSGITSNALGSDHMYPTSLTDQQNLTAIFLKSQLPNQADNYKLWCSDSAGVWDRRVHTAAQIQSIGLAVFAKVTMCQDKYAALLNELKEAQSVTAVDAVTW